MISRSRRRIGSDNTWPGFVDALSTMLLVIMFLLSMFVLAQFFLGQALSGRDEALEQLHSQVAELGNLLRLEREAGQELRFNIGQLSTSLQAANMDKEDLVRQVTNLNADLVDANARIDAMQQSGDDTSQQLDDYKARYATSAENLETQTKLTAQAQRAVERLTASITALRQQLSRIEAILEASELKDKEQQAIIANLGKRLNAALAAKVEELAGFRSEFYGRLRQLLGNRGDVRVEGDRFIFQSELLFGSGSAELGVAGQQGLAQFAQTLLDISATIPPDIKWILRVDGHTDKQPIATTRFPSNWELSTARAISVVKFLVAQGVPSNKLAATGFGEFQPLDNANTPQAFIKNRRIEMRLTQR
jgi:chemotaxis protein MotB